MHLCLARHKERAENYPARFSRQIVVGVFKLQRARFTGINPGPAASGRIEINAAELVENPQHFFLVEEIVMKPDRLQKLTRRGRQQLSLRLGQIAFFHHTHFTTCDG